MGQQYEVLEVFVVVVCFDGESDVVEIGQLFLVFVVECQWYQFGLGWQYLVVELVGYFVVEVVGVYVGN